MKKGNREAVTIRFNNKFLKATLIEIAEKENKFINDLYNEALENYVNQKLKRGGETNGKY